VRRAPSDRPPAAGARRRTASARGPAPAAAAEPLLIRLPSGDRLEMASGVDVKRLQREAMYWAYVVRSRRRWAGTQLASDSPIRRLFSEDQLKAIAEAGIAEVDIPFTEEGVGWEWRILPWDTSSAKPPSAIAATSP
jgi:hypothetical protein